MSPLRRPCRTVNTMTSALGHYGGDYFSSAATFDGSQFYTAGGLTSSSGSGYCIGAMPYGSAGLTWPTSPQVNYVRCNFARATVISPFDGKLYYSMDTDIQASTSGALGVAPATSALGFAPLGLPGLIAPQGFDFQNASALWVADWGAGLKLFRRNATGGWKLTRALVVPASNVSGTPTSGNVSQVAVGSDGSAVYVTTPSAVWALGTSSLTWSSAPMFAAPAGTELRGIVLAPQRYFPSPTQTDTTSRSPNPTTSASWTPYTGASPSGTPSVPPVPSVALTSSPTGTRSGTPLPSSTGTGAGTPRATSSTTSSLSATGTGSVSSSATPTPSVSASQTGTSSPSESSSITMASSGSRTAVPSSSKSRVPTPTRSKTATRSKTKTRSKTRTRTRTRSPSKKKKLL